MVMEHLYIIIYKYFDQLGDLMAPIFKSTISHEEC